MISHIDAQVDGPHRGDEVGRGDIRLFADVFRIEAQEELGHRRIPGDDEVGDERPIDPAHGEQFFDDAIKGGDDDLLQLLQSPDLCE